MGERRSGRPGHRLRLLVGEIHVVHGLRVLLGFGHDVVDPDHRLIGTISDVLYDHQGEAEWAVVDLGLLRSAHYLPVASGYKLCAQLRNARLRVLRACTHCLPSEEPWSCIEWIRRFLDDAIDHSSPIVELCHLPGEALWGPGDLQRQLSNVGTPVAASAAATLKSGCHRRTPLTGKYIPAPASKRNGLVMPSA